MNTTATTRTSTATSSTDDHLRQGFPTATIDSPRLTMQTAGWILGVVVAVGIVAVSAAVLGAAHSVDSASRRLAATPIQTTPDSVDSANRRTASTTDTHSSTDAAARRQ